MDKLVWVNADTEIIKEIQDKEMSRDDVAQTYAFLIRQSHKDFKIINQKIINRWSKSGLEYIKKKAWAIQ